MSIVGSPTLAPLRRREHNRLRSQFFEAAGPGYSLTRPAGVARAGLCWRICRCARIIFSIPFHMGQWSPQECADFPVGLQRRALRKDVVGTKLTRDTSIDWKFYGGNPGR